VSRRRAAAVLLAAITVLGVAPAVRAAPAMAERLTAIDAAAREELASGRTPGLSVGVMQDGKIIFLRGYGQANLETATPVTPRTVFRVGSITKQFTAAAVMLLVQEGKLSLDDKVAKYIPDLERADEITVRQLLNHTSGLANYTERRAAGPNDFRTDLTTDQMVAHIEHLKPLFDFAPGEGWHYTNSGLFLAGAIVERVSGQPLADFVRERLLKPQAIATAGVDANRDIVPNRASGYELVPGMKGVFRNANLISMTVPGGAGAMRATAGDLLRWNATLLGGRVVSPASVLQMLTPGRLKDGRLSGVAMKLAPNEAPSEYGLGLRLSPSGKPRRVSHGGNIDGFNAMLAAAPDSGLTWVVLENVGGGGSAKLAERIEHTLLP
jgi:D-alanyl-D-alanine carboxypeptidase